MDNPTQLLRNNRLRTEYVATSALAPTPGTPCANAINQSIITVGTGGLSTGTITLAALGVPGALPTVCYGRYTLVNGIWTRDGGHSLSLVKIRNWCGTHPTFVMSDPASDWTTSTKSRA